MTSSDPTVEESVGDEPASGRPDAAPYVAYSRFTSLIERLRKDGLPQVFDQSFFGTQSGSLTAQQRGALKFLDLIDDERRPTNTLRELVGADDADGKTLLKMLAEDKYATHIALGMDATRGQLTDLFRQRGLTGETVNKAIGFFLALTDDVGVTVSPHFKKGAAATGNGGSRKTTRRKKTAEPQKQTPTPPPIVLSALTSKEAQHAAYVKMLMDMAQKTDESGKVDTGLLDRIEKMLGVSTPTDTTTTTEAGQGR